MRSLFQNAWNTINICSTSLTASHILCYISEKTRWALKPHPSRMKMKLTFGNRAMSDSHSLRADCLRAIIYLKVSAYSMKHTVICDYFWAKVLTLVVLNTNNRTNLATVCKVISWSHGIVISSSLVGFSDFQRNHCFGSKLAGRFVYRFAKQSSLF